MPPRRTDTSDLSTDPDWLLRYDRDEYPIPDSLCDECGDGRIEAERTYVHFGDVVRLSCTACEYDDVAPLSTPSSSDNE